MRSLPAGAPLRSFHRATNWEKVANISPCRCSSVSTRPPGPGVVRMRSDARGRSRRYSKGKSNRVASIWLVSSTETLSTKSKVSPTGSSSRILPARSRIRGAMAAMLAEENIGVTTLRWASCSGGSRPMKLVRGRSSGGVQDGDAAQRRVGGEGLVVAVHCDDVVELGDRPIGAKFARRAPVHRVFAPKPLEPRPVGVGDEVLHVRHLEVGERSRIGPPARVPGDVGPAVGHGALSLVRRASIGRRGA